MAKKLHSEKKHGKPVVEEEEDDLEEEDEDLEDDDDEDDADDEETDEEEDEEEEESPKSKSKSKSKSTSAASSDDENDGLGPTDDDGNVDWHPTPAQVRRLTLPMMKTLVRINGMKTKVKVKDEATVKALIEELRQRGAILEEEADEATEDEEEDADEAPAVRKKPTSVGKPRFKPRHRI